MVENDTKPQRPGTFSALINHKEDENNEITQPSARPHEKTFQDKQRQGRNGLDYDLYGQSSGNPYDEYETESYPYQDKF